MVRSAPSKGTLSAPRRALLELLQQLNFGRLESIRIQGGEPLMSPLPRVIREVKFGGENGPRPEHHADDFLLKSQIVELFAYLDEVRNGVIDVLEVKHGLPFRLVVTDAA